MRTIDFETEMGSGQIEYTHRDDTFEIYVHETYRPFTEDDVIADIENNIYIYI